MSHLKRGLFLVLVMLSLALLTACSSQNSIVGRWDFSEANWSYDWIEFYEEGAYADNWGNLRTYSIPSEGQVMVTSQLDGYTMVWNYEVDGNTIIIKEDDGKAVQGVRSQ